MRKILFFAFAMVITVAASANSIAKKSKAPKAVTYSVVENQYDNDGNANVVDVDAYDVAQIGIPARVRVVKGDKYGVNVIASDKQAEKTVHYSVKNGVIRFYSSAADELENGVVVINLVVPSVPEIRTLGNFDKYVVR